MQAKGGFFGGVPWMMDVGWWSSIGSFSKFELRKSKFFLGHIRILYLYRGYIEELYTVMFMYYIIFMLSMPNCEVIRKGLDSSPPLRSLAFFCVGWCWFHALWSEGSGFFYRKKPVVSWRNLGLRSVVVGSLVEVPGLVTLRKSFVQKTRHRDAVVRFLQDHAKIIPRPKRRCW